MHCSIGSGQEFSDELEMANTFVGKLSRSVRLLRIVWREVDVHKDRITHRHFAKRYGPDHTDLPAVLYIDTNTPL